MKRGIFILLILLFSILFSFSVYAAVLDVPGDNATIQEAIDSATNGDTILVDDGAYNETLTINKNNLNITSVNGASLTIIDLQQPSETTGIWILANNTIFNGFTVMNISTTSSHAQYAIRVRGLNNLIKNNIIIGQSSRDWWTDEEDSAINLDGTSTIETANNIIENNEILNFSAMGIQVVGSGNYNAHDNIIRNNNIHDIQFYAIANDRSADQTIQNNLLTNIGPSGYSAGGYPAAGIVVWGSNSAGTEIISQNLAGIEVGVALSAAKEIVIENSEINNNSIGIRLTKSSWLTGKVEDNEIKSNIITNNDYGILIGSGNSSEIGNNEINYNLISGNNFGLNSSAAENINATLNNWGACDGPSGEGPGSGDSVSVNVTYTPWLGACIENKTIEPSCVLKTDNATLYANVTGYCVDNVKFGVNIGGIWNNYSYATQSGTIYSYILNSNLLIAGQNVLWTVYADDCYNHTTQNGIENFYVNRRTNLSVNPVSPNGLNSWYITEPIFTLTNLDSSSIWYRWDSTGNLIYTSPFGLENISNPPPVSAGTLELTYFSDVCANESEQSRLFYIDLTSPQFNDLTPLGNVYNNLKPEISAYIDEVWGSNSGINKPSVVMKVDGNDVSASVVDADELDAIVSFTPTSDLSIGKHNVTVNVTDNAGRNNQTFWEFSINTTPVFNLTVNSPVNKPYNNPYGGKRVAFNISATEDLEKIEFIDWNERVPKWKKLCSDCDEYGYSNRKTKTFNDGEHNITIRATDSFEQVKEINVSFFIDSKEPKISIIKPVRGKVTNGSSFYVKYTEENLKEVSVSWNPNQTLVDCNESGKNKECYIDLNLSSYDGQYIDYYFNVSDYVRSIQSRVTRVLVDTTSPILTVNLPNETSYGRSIPFNLSVSEKVRLEYYDNSELSPRWRNLCSNCDEYGNSRKKTKSFSRGTHNILIRALDKAGNSDVGEVSFEVNY